MKHSGLWWISLILGLCGAPDALAQLPALESGGHFLTDDDSLGYDQFRQLSADQQLEARDSARGWLGWSRDAVSVSGGQSRFGVKARPNRADTPEESRVALERALDCAATAVGYCPYMAEAWIQYGDVAMRLGRPEIAVRLAAVDDGARVSIADNGIGMTPEEREKVFNKFYQSTASSEGSGVGLSICKRIVEQLGGRIRFESEGKNSGATASVTLPLSLPPQQSR